MNLIIETKRILNTTTENVFASIVDNTIQFGDKVSLNDIRYDTELSEQKIVRCLSELEARGIIDISYGKIEQFYILKNLFVKEMY